MRSSVERTGKKIDCRSRFQRDKRLMIGAHKGGAHPTELVIATEPIDCRSRFQRDKERLMIDAHKGGAHPVLSLRRSRMAECRRPTWQSTEEHDTKLEIMHIQIDLSTKRLMISKM